MNLFANVDCFEGLRALEPQSIDLVFADLPYGRTQNAWDRPLDLKILWELLRRVVKPMAPIVFTAIQPFASELVVSNRAWFRYEMIWRKNKPTGFLNARRQPLRNFENLLVFYKRPPKYRPQYTHGHQPSNAARRKPRATGTNYSYDTAGSTFEGGKTWRYPTAVLDIPIINNDDPNKIHPTQKPEALPAWFIRAHTDPGDRVLDPTAGSASALAAAAELGRWFDGFERDATYFAAAHAMLQRRGIECRTI